MTPRMDELTARATDRYGDVRRTTEALCAPLSIEDHVVQSMPDASPAKWHLAHTTWFLETFVVLAARPDLGPVHPRYAFLFNSYYDTLGARHARPERGLLTRPSLDDVRAYRRAIDARVREVMPGLDDATRAALELGLHHEQQHQELLVQDVKHLLSKNPLEPVYRARPRPKFAPAGPLGWRRFDAGDVEIGHHGDSFAFDNERPRHRAIVAPFLLADRLVTAGEWLAFMADGGYARPTLWLSDGWATRQARGWEAPLYWRREGDRWLHFTLAGTRPVEPDEPVAHVSFYEADAFARWSGARLPREEEWEVAAAFTASSRSGFLESDMLHPRGVDLGEPSPRQLTGVLWQWTSSPYVAYPRYRRPDGALGEYNAKFMCNQLVLRGGSCATPRTHFRATYRNFFQPDARWQLAGVRLARDA